MRQGSQIIFAPKKCASAESPHTLLVLYLQEQIARILSVAPLQVHVRRPLSAPGIGSARLELTHRGAADPGGTTLSEGLSPEKLASEILTPEG